MNLPLFIAKRYLVSKKSHNAINIISAISVVGVCIGTAALVIVLSAFNGISDLVLSLYNSFDPDIKITITEGKTFVPDSITFQKIKNLDGVAYYTEVIQENVLLKYNDKQCIATIKGVTDDFVTMTRLDTLLRDGKFLLGNDTSSFAVVGAGIAEKLGLSVNDYFNPIEIFSPKRENVAVVNPADAFNIRYTYCSGVFAINEDFDSKYALLPILFVKSFLGYKNELTAVEIGLMNSTNKESVQKEIKKLLGENFSVKSRFEQNAVLFKTIKSEKWWTFLILAFILIIATFNVIGSLTMLIIDKKRDITTLSNLGADVKLIRKIFLAEGVFITLIGAVSGLLLGILVCFLQQKFKFVPFSKGFIVDAYPVQVMPMDMLYVFLTVMLIGLFAAWYPVKIFTKRNFTLYTHAE